jgi:hypothetical protein
MLRREGYDVTQHTRRWLEDFYDDQSEEWKQRTREDRMNEETIRSLKKKLAKEGSA